MECTHTDTCLPSQLIQVKLSQKSLVYAQQPFIVVLIKIEVNHCISQTPTLKSPLVDFKQGCECGVSYHSLVEIQVKGHKIRGHLFICTLQCIFLPCVTRYAIQQYFIRLSTTSIQTALMTYMRIANGSSRHLLTIGRIAYYCP